MKRNFSSFIEAFLEYNQSLGVSKKFLLWSAISGVAGALERRVWINKGNQDIFPNLFIMLIADSGIASKSTASRPIMDLLYQVEGLHFMSTQMSGASLVKQMAEVGNKKPFEHDGVTYKNSSIFSYSSEAKVTIGDAKGLNGVQELLTDFYDCGDPNKWSNVKGWNKETLSGGSITVWNPCLNLLYCSTPTWLMEALGKSGIAGGFASRVLFVNEKERFLGDQSWNEDEADEEAYKKSEHIRKLLIEDLTAISKLKGRFKTAKGFGEVYNEILTQRNIKLDEGGEMASYYSRKMWHCLKLAQVMCAQETSDMIITPEQLIKAKDALESLEPTMYEPFSIQGENKLLSSMFSVWNIMRKKKSWTKTDLLNCCYRHASITQLDELLRTFANMGKIKVLSGTDGKIHYQVIDQSPLESSATKF